MHYNIQHNFLNQIYWFKTFFKKSFTLTFIWLYLYFKADTYWLNNEEVEERQNKMNTTKFNMLSVLIVIYSTSQLLIMIYGINIRKYLAVTYTYRSTCVCMCVFSIRWSHIVQCPICPNFFVNKQYFQNLLVLHIPFRF